MRLNSYTASLLTSEELAQRITVISEPAVLVGGDMKIIARNTAASSLFFDLRRGRSFQKFLSEFDAHRILEMAPRQVLHTELINDSGSYGATVVCAADCRLIVVRPLEAGIHSRLESIYGKSSGYDINFSEPENRQIPVTFPAEVLKNTREVRFFNISEVVRGITSELKPFLQKLHCSTDFSSCASELITVGSEYDLAMIIAYLVAYCAEISDNGKVSISVLEEDGAAVRVSAPTSFTPYELLQLKSGISPDALGVDGYWLRLIRLLADGNLWDLESGSGENGEAYFILRAPLTDKPKTCILRDVKPEYIRKILEFVFSTYKKPSKKLP